MGYTIEDMLITGRDKYDMKLIAGEHGWANSISWLLMIEDTIITKNFKGKELVVTTGLGFDTEEKLLELVQILDEHHSSGLIVNTGFYLYEIPPSVISYCNEVDLPLMTVPWDIAMSEMIKDITALIFLQTATDTKISEAFTKAIEHPELVTEYREELSASFDTDGKFQAVLFTTEDLDSMDSMDRRRIGYRLQIYLENISHNAHFYYYDGYFILILNAVGEEDKEAIIRGFLERAKRRMPEKQIYVGEGSAVYDVSMVHITYERAKYAVLAARKQGKPHIRFDEMGLERALYSITDSLIKQEMGIEKLAPIIDYDRDHDGQLLETFRLYLEYGGSVARVSEELYSHKNTIVYRMNKIKELLGTDLESGQERMEYYLSCMLYRMWS